MPHSSLSGQIGASARWARTDSEGRKQQVERMRLGRDRRFARIALFGDGNPTDAELDAAIAATPAAELASRIEHARREHLLRASLQSKKARDAKRAAES